LVRCRLLLETKDGRTITENFFPARAEHSFTAEKRGAYFSSFDEFAVFDILGFFRLAFRLPAEEGARLLVSPRAADEPLPVNARAGDSSLKPEFSFQRTDNLIDHRPYIPGDDPRRINWKLYGHGGGLFVREGEREPPPHSNIIILIDTEYDSLLYSAPSARHGIDLLCENALAAAIACSESGMDVVIGFTGGAVYGGKAKELASALARPAAICRSSAQSPSVPASALPAAPEDRGILVLALPRTEMETRLLQKPTSLDHFLQEVANNRRVDIVFLCGGTTDDDRKRLTAAAACAAIYGRRPGVSARAAGV
jgi:uncharacterized protein (DUF58 family)